MRKRNVVFDEFFHKTVKEILAEKHFLLMKNYIAHGRYSVYDHCFRVSLLAYSMAKRKNMKVDYVSLIRGSLLHDFYLYDWHHSHEGHRLHGFRHPYFSYRNSIKYFSISRKEKNMIKSHMFPLTIWALPFSKEAWILTIADKICAHRETFYKE